MRLEPRTCKWHECYRSPPGGRATFEPVRTTQDFCCAECRKAYAMWCQRRGAPLVTLLLAENWNGLEEARQSLKRELDQ